MNNMKVTYERTHNAMNNFFCLSRQFWVINKLFTADDCFYDRYFLRGKFICKYVRSFECKKDFAINYKYLIYSIK